MGEQGGYTEGQQQTAASSEDSSRRYEEDARMFGSTRIRPTPEKPIEEDSDAGIREPESPTEPSDPSIEVQTNQE